LSGYRLAFKPVPVAAAAGNRRLQAATTPQTLNRLDVVANPTIVTELKDANDKNKVADFVPDGNSGLTKSELLYGKTGYFDWTK